jgi:toxin ParE1/3/4
MTRHPLPAQSPTTTTSSPSEIASDPPADRPVAKPVRLRQLAATDLQNASEFYRQQGGEQTALAFIDVVERAIRRIGGNPNVGSLRYSYELAIPELRARPLSRFPFIVFYVDAEEIVDVWRILHGLRDIPTTLQQPDA